MPKQKDMTGPALELFRLQHSFGLSTTNIANGNIPGTWITSALPGELNQNVENTDHCASFHK